MLVLYDVTLAIGKRYRRQDEIGTPFCITVDFDTLDDQAVTIRHRDSMQQERVALDKVVSYLAGSEPYARTDHPGRCGTLRQCLPHLRSRPRDAVRVRKR
jgi:glycyl-tRNA synthetase (class II)